MNEFETPGATPEVSADPAPQPQPEVSYSQPQTGYTQPVYTEPEKPKKGFPKVLLIVLAVLAVGAVAFFGIRAAAASKPLNKTALGIQKAAEAFGKNDMAALALNAQENGSVSVTVDLSKIGSQIMYGMGNLPVKVSITGYTSAKSQKGALEFDAQIKGKSVVNGTVTASEDQIAASCEAILGKTGYSLDIKNIAKNLPKSFLDPDSDSQYAFLPDEVYDWLVSQKNGPIAPAKELAEDAQSLVKEAAKLLLRSLEKNASISKANETVSIGDKDIKTTAVTVSLNGKQAAAVATDLLKWAKNSKDLKSLITKFADSYGPLLEDSGFDPDDILDEFNDAIDDAIDECADMEEEDLDLTCLFYVNNSNGQLVKAEITNKDDYSGKTVYTLEGGPDWKNPTYISVSTKDRYSKESYTFTVEENTKSQFTGKLKIKEDGSTTGTITFSWDKSAGDLRISSSELDFKLTGTMTQKGKVTTITLKKLEYGYITIKDLGTTIEINESAKLPTISKTTEILSLDEDALTDVIEDIREAIEDLRDTIEDAMD